MAASSTYGETTPRLQPLTVPSVLSATIVAFEEELESLLVVALPETFGRVPELRWKDIASLGPDGLW